MKIYSSNRLLSIYPQFFTYFVERYKQPEKQFAISDGWFPLLFNVFYRLDMLQDIHIDHDIRITALQIKEKLGGLRLYYKATVENESWFSKTFRKCDYWIRTKMCKQGFSKIYWKMNKWRATYIYKTIYEKIQEIICKAEAKSYKTCEVCGEPGELCKPNGYWLLVLCKKHEKEEKK